MADIYINIYIYIYTTFFSINKRFADFYHSEYSIPSFSLNKPKLQKLATLTNGVGPWKSVRGLPLVVGLPCYLDRVAFTCPCGKKNGQTLLKSKILTDLALKKNGLLVAIFLMARNFIVLNMNYLNLAECFFSKLFFPKTRCFPRSCLPGKRLGFFANTFTNSMCPPLTPSFEGLRVDESSLPPPLEKQGKNS